MSLYLGDRAIPSATSYAEVRPLLRWVYIWMFIGLLVTAGTAFLTATNVSLLQVRTSSPVVFGSFFVQLGLVMALSWGIRRMSPTLAGFLFIVYAALNGFVFSLILIYFRVGTIAAAFATASILFGIMSLVGYTTDVDLTKMGSYLLMALIGLIVAMIVNIFLNSGPLDFLISLIGVVIFTALTAYDTQAIKRMAAQPELQADGSMAAKMSIYAALSLYLNFLNLFLFLLRLSGGRR